MLAEIPATLMVSWTTNPEMLLAAFEYIIEKVEPLMTGFEGMLS